MGAELSSCCGGVSDESLIIDATAVPSDSNLLRKQHEGPAKSSANPENINLTAVSHYNEW